MDKKKLYEQYTETHENAKDLFVKAYFVNDIERTCDRERYKELTADCQSKIEVLFLHTFLTVMDVCLGIDKNCETRLHEVQIYPQCDVEHDEKVYYIDFSIDGVSFDRNVQLECYPEIFVEIDGYEYHSTKQQLTHDRERENFLKKYGHNVVRFTGTQVFCDPLKSVFDALEIYANETHERAQILDVLKNAKKFFEG